MIFLASQKLKYLCVKAQSYFNLPRVINRLSLNLFDSFSQPLVLNKTDINDRGTILLRICQAMIAVIILQSFKYAGAPDMRCHSAISLNIINLENIYCNVSYLHIANMLLHILLFSCVLFLLKKSYIKVAKYILLSAFCSYILIACLLWQYNLNLQYYFLLSMFVSCYIFDKHEKRYLMIAICIQIGLFIVLHQSLPSLHGVNSLLHATGAYLYLQHISQINTYVFAISCVICALFIRKILAHNWHTLTQYEATQSALLKKLFPAQLMPSLLLAQSKQQSNLGKNPVVNKGFIANPNNAMQSTQQMGVVFLDICQFTQLTSDKNSEGVSWQAIYHLFASFDLAIEQLDAKRIKTNGDQYILLVGLNSENIAKDSIALQTIKACKELLHTSNLSVKIGAAFGSVTCGIFDPNNPNFDIWGETVIRAARLEAIAKPNTILIDIHLHTLTKSYIDYAQPTLQNLKGLGKQLACELPGG